MDPIWSTWFSRLAAPCPSSGLIVHGDKDIVAPAKDVTTLVEKLKTQKGIVIDQQTIPGANVIDLSKMTVLPGLMLMSALMMPPVIQVKAVPAMIPF